MPDLRTGFQQTRLYDTYANRVGHYLLVYLGLQNDADDVLQRRFFAWLASAHKLAKVDDLDAYVITIARNEAARLAAGNVRRQQKQKPLPRGPVLLSAE